MRYYNTWEVGVLHRSVAQEHGHITNGLGQIEVRERNKTKWLLQSQVETAISGHRRQPLSAQCARKAMASVQAA